MIESLQNLIHESHEFSRMLLLLSRHCEERLSATKQSLARLAPFADKQGDYFARPVREAGAR